MPDPQQQQKQQQTQSQQIGIEREIDEQHRKPIDREKEKTRAGNKTTKEDGTNDMKRVQLGTTKNKNIIRKRNRQRKHKRKH